MPLTLEIVTPTRLVLRKQVDSFTGPGKLGEFGILPAHRPLLAALRAGLARYSEDGKEHRLAIGPGFAELDNDRIIVLTDEVFEPERLESPEERDEARRNAADDRDKADAAVRSWTGPVTADEFEENVLALEWARARLAALGE
ncbi:MAG: ATP synthase F1 subunit epsilon [Myxococcales bacterium]|nr:ATP synthase F1 subunit epsilon [Myxococcales bacterium]